MVLNFGTIVVLILIVLMIVDTVRKSRERKDRERLEKTKMLLEHFERIERMQGHPLTDDEKIEIIYQWEKTNWMRWYYYERLLGKPPPS